VETIFVLGDLFEFWLGAPGISYPQYQPVLDRLQRLVRNGIRLVCLEGNHDFHLGPVFTETLQADVHPGPVVMELDGRRLYLCHGDQMNRRDYAYRCLRAVFHSRLTRLLARLVPAVVPLTIADRLGSRSKAAAPQRNARWDYDRIIREFAAERFREGVEAVITGHFHRPFLEENGKTVLLSLGDWISQFSYGEWRDGVLSLRTFPQSAQPSPNRER
jgi:UDP-2,3-diacylglucosamine hydrolase